MKATAQRRLLAVQRRLEGSWVDDFATRLRAIDLANSITLFGAALLLSVLPFLILLSSIADERIDDDISRHIGLNRVGAHIVRGLFRNTPSHSAAPIVLGLMIGFAGSLTMVSFLQVIYERVFEQDHRGWRDLPRFVLWGVVLLGALVAEALLGGEVRSAAGPVARGLLSFLGVTIFIVWSMHLLLAGRVRWRLLIRPALVSALLWLLLSLFSSAYFSSSIVSDNRLYGAIGVVFTLTTWFIAIGAVLVLGAVGGVVWQERRGKRLRSSQA